MSCCYHGYSAIIMIMGVQWSLLFQPEKCGLNLEVVLKWRDICVENIIVVSLIAGLKLY